MAPKQKKIESYKFDTTAWTTESWVVNDEYVADEDIVILGFLISQIGRGVNGAIAVSKSGTIDPSVPRQDDVYTYQECAGVGGATGAVLSHGVLWFPEDARPELDKGERIYLWGESMQTNIGHALMYFYEK